MVFGTLNPVEIQSPPQEEVVNAASHVQFLYQRVDLQTWARFWFIKHTWDLFIHSLYPAHPPSCCQPTEHCKLCFSSELPGWGRARGRIINVGKLLQDHRVQILTNKSSDLPRLLGAVRSQISSQQWEMWKVAWSAPLGRKSIAMDATEDESEPRWGSPPAFLTQQACCTAQPEHSWRAGNSLHLHDFGEVIIHEDHVGSLFADVRARLPHGDADVRGFQRHGVVDSVPRHGHHGPSPLQGLWEGTAHKSSSQNIDKHKKVWAICFALFVWLCLTLRVRQNWHHNEDKTKNWEIVFFRSIGNLTTPAEVRKGE